jgi:hypothetical protein
MGGVYSNSAGGSGLQICRVQPVEKRHAFESNGLMDRFSSPTVVTAPTPAAAAPASPRRANEDLYTVEQMLLAAEACQGFEAVRDQQRRLGEIVGLYHKLLATLSKPMAKWTKVESNFVQCAREWFVPFASGSGRAGRYGTSASGKPLDRQWASVAGHEVRVPPPRADGPDVDAMCRVINRAAIEVTATYHKARAGTAKRSLAEAQQQAAAWIQGAMGTAKEPAEVAAGSALLDLCCTESLPRATATATATANDRER